MKILGCKIFRRGNKNSRKVAFTFDDGPNVKFTPIIMDALEKHNVCGTFFTTGNNLEKNRSLAEEMTSRGHLIGNHTYSHPHALYTGRGKLRDEILRSKNLIEEITGSKNRIFRPPFGFVTPSLLSICRNLELSIILWDSNSKDYRGINSENIKKRVFKTISQGSIILFHDSKFSNSEFDYTSSIEALKSVLEDIIMRGWKPVTVENLLGDLI